jgi:hypothetical protein
MSQRKKLPDESKTKEEGEEKHRGDDQSRVKKKQSKLAVMNICGIEDTRSSYPNNSLSQPY